jgi:hypothetical protein
MTTERLSDEQIRAEWLELRQIVAIIAGSYPSKYILGKTGDRVGDVCRRVVEGRPLF